MKKTNGKLILYFVLIAFIVSGCASISYRSEDCQQEPVYIYPATQVDIEMYSFFVREGGFRLEKIPIAIILLVPLFIDLPFSVAIDTVLLPYDLYCRSKEKDNRFYCNEMKLQDYNALIDKQPKDPSSYLKRAKYLRKRGKNEAAMQDIKRSLEIDPRYSDAYYTRALWTYDFLDENTYNVSLQDLNKAIEFNNKNVKALELRGKVKEEIKDFDGAIADYDSAIEIDEKYAWAYYYRGSLYYHHLNNDSKALEDLRKAKSLFDDQGDDFGYKLARDSIKFIKHYPNANAAGQR